MAAKLGGGGWLLAATGLDGICMGTSCAGLFCSLAAGGGAVALAAVLHAVVGLGFRLELGLVLPLCSGGLWNKFRGVIFQGSWASWLDSLKVKLAWLTPLAGILGAGLVDSALQAIVLASSCFIIAAPRRAANSASCSKI